MNKFLAFILGIVMMFGLAACSTERPVNTTDPPAESTDPIDSTSGYEVEVPGEGPASASKITSVGGVPLATLNNGVQMPRFGLGTQIQRLESGDLGILNQTSREAVTAALQAGYRHLDTAHGYMNERGVGQGIIDSGIPREEIWLTSKLWPSEYGDAYNAINEMLERLQVEYLDLVYLHHPAGDLETIASAWQGLEQAYREGKIRALGISNFDNRMEAFNLIMEQEIKPQTMQIEGHPFAQRLETRELAEQYNIQVECWYPLGHADERLLNAEALEAIAAAHEKSVVQIILRWHMQEGFSAIPGSTNPDHIQENIEIFDFELTDEEMEQIRAMDQGEDGRYFNLDYEMMGAFFTNPVREWEPSDGGTESVISSEEAGAVDSYYTDIDPDSFGTVTAGTDTYRDFVLDNVLHSPADGEIHYNVYVPEGYDGSSPYALFVTLPGYEGLYFQGVATNIRAERFGFEAQRYNSEMIVVAPQLSDWGETSANQTIALVEYFLSHYSIDPSRVYANGYSGGGETMSIVMGKRPELFCAYLHCSSQWDGDLEVLASSKTPVYLAIGRDDEYYGSENTQQTYDALHELYLRQGLTEEEIGELLVLDIKEHTYFTDRGVNNEHGGGGLFAQDEEMMGWLFGKMK